MIFGLTDDIELTCQPFCELQFTSGVTTYPVIDDIIWLFFEGGDIFRPIYLGTIYTGLSIDCDEGLKRFFAKRPKAITDQQAFRTTLRTVNQLTTPDSKLVVQDVHQQFSNFMLPEDSIKKVFLTGKSEVKYISEPSPFPFPPNLPPVLTPVMPCHPLWLGKFPKTFNKDPKPMYLWYKTEDTPNALGGWTFYTEENLKNGLASFPDNLAHINYKRYQTWKDLVNDSYYFVEDVPSYTQSRPIDWNFIPLPPWHYWHPEMMIGGSSQFHQLMSFPFGKMNLNNRKNYKQHTILSHDGKSAIELDDNDGYERLRIDFNYSGGGLEFSNAGFRGFELWTDGAIHLHAEGKQIGQGRGNDSRFVFNRSNWNVFSDADIGFVSKGNQVYFSTNSINLVGKYGTIGLKAGSGISLTSKGASDADPLGTPVVSAPGDCTSQMWGNFLFFDGKTKRVSDAEAVQWMTYFHAAMSILRNLCGAISRDMGLKVITYSTEVVAIAAQAAVVLAPWDIDSKGISLVKLAGAWEGIQMQVGQ